MAARIWFQLYYSFIHPEGMKGWLGLVSWPVADGLPTLVVAHQLQVERRTESLPVRDRRSTTVLHHQPHCMVNETKCHYEWLFDWYGILCHTHTHPRLTALFPGLPRWAGTRKAQPIWILLKQETVSGSGISWNICKSAPRSRQIVWAIVHVLKLFWW